MQRFQGLPVEKSYVYHFRNDIPPRKPIPGIADLDERIKAVTVSVVFCNNTCSYGVARCCGLDQFSKKLARNISYGRAKKAASMAGKISPQTTQSGIFADGSYIPKSKEDMAGMARYAVNYAIIKINNEVRRYFNGD